MHRHSAGSSAAAEREEVGTLRPACLVQADNSVQERLSAFSSVGWTNAEQT